MTRLDTRPVPTDVPEEIRVFAVVQNEMVRLPYFLTYHRNLGVRRFFFVDNKSTDGTREFLLAQPDCHVFHTANSYAESRYGIDWSNALLDLYGVGHWCMVLDADELLIYPHCETVNLRKFCDFLEQEGSEGLYTFMLDMYPEGSLADAVCTPDKPFFETAPFFDKDYKLVDRIYLRGAKPFPRQEVIGGPRARCFYGDQGADSVFWRYVMHIIERSVVFLRRKKIPVPYPNLKAPAIFKVPLVKWKPGLAYISSTHILQEIRLSSVSGMLLHFKFFSDFHDRVMAAVRSGEHAAGSSEYKMYLARMNAIGSFRYEGSVRYDSSADVLNAGLMHSSGKYEAFCG